MLNILRPIRVQPVLALLLEMLATATSQPDAIQLFPCGYNYFSKAEGWFKMHTKRATWREAKNRCFSEGSQLASPTSEAIKKAMMSLMVLDHEKYNETSNMSVHTAMHATGQNCWVGKEPPTLALSETGHFENVNRNTALPYICYKRALQILQECGVSDPEYKLDKRTDQCYKFHRSRKDWSVADITCKSEGGHLAVINSEEEAKVIQEIFAENPADVIPGYDFTDVAFIGFRADDNGTWRTVRGESLSEAGYEVWSAGEPNEHDSCRLKNGENLCDAEFESCPPVLEEMINDDEYCGSFGRDGKLFDDPCSRRLPYICEKNIVFYSCDTPDASASPYFC